MACYRCGYAACVWHLEQADEMLAMAVDKRCHRLDPHNIHPATYQWKTLRPEIGDCRCKSKLTVKPRLYCMVTRRSTSVGCGAIRPRTWAETTCSASSSLVR